MIILENGAMFIELILLIIRNFCSTIIGKQTFQTVEYLVVAGGGGGGARAGGGGGAGGLRTDPCSSIEEVQQFQLL